MSLYVGFLPFFGDEKTTMAADTDTPVFLWYEPPKPLGFVPEDFERGTLGMEGP